MNNVVEHALLPDGGLAVITATSDGYVPMVEDATGRRRYLAEFGLPQSEADIDSARAVAEAIVGRLYPSQHLALVWRAGRRRSESAE
jgi:hypothetical protein